MKIFRLVERIFFNEFCLLLLFCQRTLRICSAYYPKDGKPLDPLYPAFRTSMYLLFFLFTSDFLVLTDDFAVFSLDGSDDGLLLGDRLVVFFGGVLWPSVGRLLLDQDWSLVDFIVDSRGCMALCFVLNSIFFSFEQFPVGGNFKI